MNILAINTVGPACEIGVQTAHAEFCVREEMTRGHDARIAVLTGQAIAESTLTWSELDRICVITGPGSFTGIRVGVAFAHGLALALRLPVHGVSALEAIGVEESENILAILPAQRRPPDRTWWAQRLNDGLGASDPVEIDEVAVREMGSSSAVVVGLAPPVALPVRFVERAPSALAAASLCRRMSKSGGPVRPVYVRPPDATPMASVSSKPVS